MAVDIAQLLAFAVKNNASDLHLSAGVPPMIRVDGDMKRVNMPALAHKEVHSMVYDIMNDKQRKAFEEFFETDFSFEIPKLARFRVNAFNQNRGAGAVFRNIPSTILSLDELNAPKTFKDLCMLPRGLVLVTGPTGSGKSTTLAGMVNHCNDNRPDHIITIEDPIEFVHESKRCLVNQREVHRDTLGFTEALRSALREDPDVVLVGEMRDLETIRLALTAAETGHLVFGTLHTSSAAKTIDRIVDVFPAAEKDMVRAMLSESLRAVISQTLMKRVGGGRIAAHEIMIGTPAIRNLIREGKIAQMYSAIQTGQGQGMQTLDQCLQELVPKGVVSREEAQASRRRTRTASEWNANKPYVLMQDLLRRMVEKKGSDLFITAGFPPAIKIDGEIRPQSDRSLTAGAEREPGARHHERPPNQGIRRDQGMQFRDRAARHRALPRQRLRAAGLHRRGAAHDQRQDSDARRTRTAADAEGRGALQARLRDPGRRHRFGQIDLAGRDGRLSQRKDPRTHRDDRGSGRIRACAQGLRRDPSRGRRRLRELASRAARTPCARRRM